MLSHNHIREAAPIKLEALREEATRHRDTDPQPFSLERVLVSLGRRATRHARREFEVPIPPSSSASRL
jgi:hypothetical protein